MIISINGIDGVGKTALIKQLGKRYHFFIPKHVSKYIEFPKDLAKWYEFKDIDKVIYLDLKAFKIRNDVAKNKDNALLDRGYLCLIDSAAARYQQRMHVSYEEAKKHVEKINQKIGLKPIENKKILLHFPSSNWEEIYSSLDKRIGPLSPSYLEYLKIFHINIESHLNDYDYILNANDKIEENITKLSKILKL